MWRVKKVLRWEVEFFYYFAVCKKTHDNFNTLPCAKKSTQQTHGFAVCQSRVPRVCRVFICRHSAKLFFAVCPRNCTRQTRWHTANAEFPVVHGWWILDRSVGFRPSRPWHNETVFPWPPLICSCASSYAHTTLSLMEATSMVALQRCWPPAGLFSQKQQYARRQEVHN